MLPSSSSLKPSWSSKEEEAQDAAIIKRYNDEDCSGIVPFPIKLHIILKILCNEGSDEIMSWLPHGRSFKVHNTRAFEQVVMKRFFRQSSISSFKRQLNMYGFQKVHYGRDIGSYYYRHFLRGRPLLAKNIGTRRRTTNTKKGEKQQARNGPPLSHHQERRRERSGAGSGNDGNAAGVAACQLSSTEKDAAPGGVMNHEENSNGHRFWTDSASGKVVNASSKCTFEQEYKHQNFYSMPYMGSVNDVHFESERIIEERDVLDLLSRRSGDVADLSVLDNGHGKSIKQQHEMSVDQESTMSAAAGLLDLPNVVGMTAQNSLLMRQQAPLSTSLSKQPAAAPAPQHDGGLMASQLMRSIRINSSLIQQFQDQILQNHLLISQLSGTQQCSQQETLPDEARHTSLQQVQLIRQTNQSEKRRMSSSLFPATSVGVGGAALAVSSVDPNKNCRIDPLVLNSLLLNAISTTSTQQEGRTTAIVDRSRFSFVQQHPLTGNNEYTMQQIKQQPSSSRKVDRTRSEETETSDAKQQQECLRVVARTDGSYFVARGSSYLKKSESGERLLQGESDEGESDEEESDEEESDEEESDEEESDDSSVEGENSSSQHRNEQRRRCRGQKLDTASNGTSDEGETSSTTRYY
ncbi:hypothetical protein CTEN210_01606 [Chaetoceros tenuissimus]|uniref:HSF-type DNA-binding domain-containing protein n=1 Tax=Chaetoceros tenuissimus TaxID=426638 RepID=A0AAD3CFG0_9STRA|nr:hypothetical protein CTEN210_01606 [Chaetoceros tenuissimus]